MGRCPTPHKLLKKLDQNFYCIGLIKLCVILGRENALRFSVSAKPTLPTKKARFLFGDVAFARPRPSFKTASK